MKKKLDISFFGEASIHEYGMYLMASEDSVSGEPLEKIIYKAMAERNDGKDEYVGRVNVTVHVELVRDPGLTVEAE